MSQHDKLQCLKIGFTAGKTMFFSFCSCSFLLFQQLNVCLTYVMLISRIYGVARGGADFLSNGSTV